MQFLLTINWWSQTSILIPLLEGILCKKSSDVDPGRVDLDPEPTFENQDPSHEKKTESGSDPRRLIQACI